LNFNDFAWSDPEGKPKEETIYVNFNNFTQSDPEVSQPSNHC